jgi:hypothetical protein
MELTWNIEAFRPYMAFECMQQAASAILLFDGVNYSDNPEALTAIEQSLQNRTGMQWLPERELPIGVNFNAEGNFMRNKGRILTSLGIIHTEEARQNKTLSLTPWGKSLALGLKTKEDYYLHQIKSFGYPHLAYPESARTWNDKNISVKPFLYLLELLVLGSECKPKALMITIEEIAGIAMAEKANYAARDAVADIEEHRTLNLALPPISSNKRRNANDLIGFLQLSGLVSRSGSRSVVELSPSVGSPLDLDDLLNQFEKSSNKWNALKESPTKEVQ